VHATESTLVAYSAALLRFEAGAPARCPVCASYQVDRRYVSEEEGGPVYASLCVVCGWNNAKAIDEEETEAE
jgi:hypothetical protein